MRFEEEAKRIMQLVTITEDSEHQKRLIYDKKIIEEIAKIISDIIDDECWDCEFYLRDNKIHEPKIHEPMWDSSELDWYDAYIKIERWK